jgi:adenylate cyclase class IV
MEHDLTLSSEALRFKEIEHKFIVDEGFDLQAFRVQLATMGPARTNRITVRDRFFLTHSGLEQRILFRHRFDAELHQLTIKSIEDDPEVRVEVNIDLGHAHGNQDAPVDAFLEQLGLRWRGTLHKALEVWYFEDCEVVYYEAFTSSLTVRCVEFEATRKGSLEQALATVARFERATGFEGATRSLLSLPQLLFPELNEMLRRASGPAPDVRRSNQ